MSGEPSSARRRSARLAAKGAQATCVDEDGATPSRPSVKADAFAATSGCQSTVKKRNMTCTPTRVAPLAKKLKTVHEEEVRENTRTKRQHRTHRASRHLEDVEKPKGGRKKTTLAETSPKREEAAAMKSLATAKRQRARAELACSGPARQTKMIRGRSTSASRSSEASQGVASSSASYHTAESMASYTGSTMPEKEDDAIPTPPVRQTKFDRLRRVWRWLVANDGAESGARNEC
ncbi:hypothetical protein HPB52_012658 [Rhipicephalus sanguineus]|uniref:Uncharacterized protein n=1 Tax=Rhipicephalus sanguineus TaxID=34632 RepID=A0A9D4T9X0_RHISA|nr:hypothetical protein HPB52_012658 [Rhipicephalus sanguineus]